MSKTGQPCFHPGAPFTMHLCMQYSYTVHPASQIHWEEPMLRIWDVYPGSRIRLFSIPDPRSEFFHPGSRIRIKEFKYFNPKWFLTSRKYDPSCSSRIRILTFYLSRIPDPGAQKAPDPGSRIRIRSTGRNR
jgi:hypothetical protein